ncbi:hypothetical protein ACW9HQ_52870, partial [Nocardia gipuzkoensis]
MVDRMRPWSFPGSYEADRGIEQIEWRIEPGAWGGYYVGTVVRGVPLCGDFDSMAPDDPESEVRDILP